MTIKRSFGLTLITVLALTSCHQNMRPPIDPDQNSQITTAKSKVIIGRDNRKTTDQVPSYMRTYRSKVGQLKGFFSNDEGNISAIFCSASLIGKNYIITAAHCAYDESGKLLGDLIFYPGQQNSTDTSYEKYKVTQISMPKNYSIHAHNADNSANDMAIMKLASSDQGDTAGEQAGYFGYWGRNEFPDGLVSTIGYPADKTLGVQYFQEDCHAQSDGNLLDINCDNFQGQSGSPILIYSPKYKIHHIQGIMNSESSSLNYGARLSAQRADIIGSIIEDQYRPSDYNEQWITIKPQLQQIVTFVKNTCNDQKIYIAYNYKNTNGNWIQEGYRVLAPGEETPIFITKNVNYYLQVLDGDNNNLTRRDRSIHLENQDEDVDMQRYHVTDWGNFTYRFGCY